MTRDTAPRSRPRRPALLRTAALLLAGATLAGCVVLPVTHATYDPQCRQVSRHTTLEPVQVGAVAGCSNQGCQALVVAAAASVAVSTIVSGSIAIVNNVAYWVEERGTCHGPAPAASAPAAAAASAATPRIGADGLDPAPAPVPRRIVRPEAATTPAPASAPIPYPGT